MNKSEIALRLCKTDTTKLNTKILRNECRKLVHTYTVLAHDRFLFRDFSWELLFWYLRVQTVNFFKIAWTLRLCFLRSIG